MTRSKIFIPTPSCTVYTIPMLWVCDKALKRFEDLVDIVDRCEYEGAPLHLKIKAYHADVANGVREKSSLKQSDIKELLMPRDWYLKSIDPDGKRPFGEVKLQIVKRAHQYFDLVRSRKAEGQYELLDALELYKSFHLIQRQTSWGDFPWG